ncbi:MAG: hypothetical protein H5U20_02805, partial [Rhodobacteraceae bacterium]|nr:hypothetical protein [Paracoccaceae bacterium]
MSLVAQIAAVVLVAALSPLGQMPEMLAGGLRQAGGAPRLRTAPLPGPDLAALDGVAPGAPGTVLIVAGPPPDPASAGFARTLGALARHAEAGPVLVLQGEDEGGAAGAPDGWETLVAAAPGGAIHLVPAGAALRAARAAIARGAVPGLADPAALRGPDGALSDRGAYLVAMTALASLGVPPEGMPARLSRRWSSRDSAVSDAMAAALQRIAAETVAAYTLPAPPPPPPPPPPPAAAPPLPEGVTNPALSVGLAAISDWSTEAPFLDQMKSARPWFGHLPGQWGGIEPAELAARGLLDAHGWPLAIPGEAAALATLILTDLPEGAATRAGRYRLRHAGDGTLELGGRARVVRRAPGELWFDFTPGPGPVIVTLRATGGPAGPIRDISVVHERHVAAFDAGAIFNPDWLARIEGVAGLRFMDWMATNGATLADWEDRPEPGDATWAANGVPVEVMVALANRLRADPWFTMPHLATDTYLRRFAAAVRDGLAPGLKAHVEFSNEVWNWQFPQARWAEAAGRARWGQDGTWVQAYAARAEEMATIWADAFGPAAAGRLVRVLAVQTGWPGLEEAILAPPLLAAERGPGAPPPATAFDAYAVTAYVSAALGTPGKAALVHGWLDASRAAAEAGARARGLNGAEAAAHVAAHRFDLARARALDELIDGRESGDPADSLADLLGRVLPYHARVAAAHGLELVMYEGGTHVAATTDDPEIRAFFENLNYSPEMGEVYRRLLDGWAALTDAPFNAHVDVAAPSGSGDWGALRHLADDNPRWRALA